MEILYNKYTNIKKFITDYRKYKIDAGFYEFNVFKKNIQVDEYIMHKCINAKKGRIVYIYLFIDQSKYLKTTNLFKRIIDKLPEEPADVIIISKDDLNIYITKSLLKYTNLRVFNYLHKYFAIELANGPLCSKHTLLTDEDVKLLCSRDLIIHPLSLPSISVLDPQNIWIGGELGQVIKIESVSEITGHTIRYRLISPDSGKIINVAENKEEDKPPAEAEDVSELIDDDEEDEPDV